MDSGVHTLPGMCSAIGSLMLAVKNEAPTAVTIDRGMHVALCAGTVAADALEEYVAAISEVDEPRWNHDCAASSQTAAPALQLQCVSYLPGMHRPRRECFVGWSMK